MSRVRRVAAFVLPSVVAAIVAAMIAGGVEGAIEVSTPLALLATIGFGALYAAPAGFVLGCGLRALWGAWRPREISAELTEASGGAPRLAAWLAYLGFSLAALSAVTFNAVRAIMSATKTTNVVALASALIVAATAMALAAASRPMVGSISRYLRAIDSKLLAARGTTMLRPRTIIVAAFAIYAAGLYLSWIFSIAPRIGHFDLGIAGYALTYGLAALVVHVGWHLARASRWRYVAAGASAVAFAAVIASAVYVRYQRPFVMLEVWGSTAVGGFVIDHTYDLEAIRSDLPLGEIRPRELTDDGHPDVILITIDTLRADRTPIYGGPARMPKLSKLAAQSTVFEWAFSPGNVTRRSMPTIATGASPRRINGRVAGWALRMDPRHVMLAERFRAAGYDTAGFFCCTSHFGPEHRLGLNRGIEHLRIDKDGGVLTAEALAWLQARERAGNRVPAFVWIHLIEPHGWEKRYTRKKHGKSLTKRYDMVLADVDDLLAPLIDYLVAPTRRASTVVALTADHGEGLGDHGHRHHAATLFNSEVRVPLVVMAQGGRRQRVPAPVGLVDLAPTLLELAGYEPPGMPAMDGQSLAPVVRGERELDPDDGEAYIVMMRDRSVPEDMAAIVSGTHKLIVQPREPDQLYDLADDPRERSDIAAGYPEIVDRLRARLSERRRIDRVAPYR